MTLEYDVAQMTDEGLKNLINHYKALSGAYCALATHGATQQHVAVKLEAMQVELTLRMLTEKM